MGRLQATTGLITGLPIQDTVKQLIAIEARPRDLVVSRNKDLSAQQVAVTELTAAVIAVQLAARNLGSAAVFNKKTVTSSNPTALTATLTGKPLPGIHSFTPIRKAQAHHLLSSGFAAIDQPLGAGTLSFGFGGFVDQAIALADLNDGQGVQRGKIRITDRDGATAVIDLRYAQTIDDVLAAINSADAVNIEAVADGDAIRLLDNTGGSGNLKVAEVNGGSTAADLGLAGINVADDEALGQDLIRLHNGLSLSRLNDGNGVQFSSAVPDLEVTLHDGSSVLVDFLQAGNAETTLGDVLDTINAADPAKLQARISADGERIELVDLTSGGGTFEVKEYLTGSAASDLGLTTSESAGVIAGRRLRGGLKSPLVSSLSGGRGFEGGLGQIVLTDRSGASANVDLSSAETLDDVVQAINAAGVGIQASVNHARNGLQLTDTTGASASNLIVADGPDALETATKLNLAFNGAAAGVDSGSLDLQTASRETRLDDYRGGVTRGRFTIRDTAGALTVIQTDSPDVQSLGDVIDLINSSSVNVQARINDRGDGLVIIDTAGGSGQLQISEFGAGATARDLGILGAGVEQEIGGLTQLAVVGSSRYTVDIGDEDDLQDLVDKINALDAGVQASIFNAGSGSTPYRISLVSQVSGKAGELLVDASGAGFTFDEIAGAQDALLEVGGGVLGGGLLATSSDDQFDGVLEGVSLVINEATGSPVSVTVATTDSSLVTNVQLFVDQYNKLVEKLDELTFFNDVENTTGVLFGSFEVLRVETELSSLLSGRFFGVGSIQSLEGLGISFNDDGTLTLDTDKLKNKFAASPAEVEKFFTEEKAGFAKKVDALAETLAGSNNSLLVSRAETLQRRIDLNNERIEFLNARLDRRQELLLLQFLNMEVAIGKLQNSLSAIDAIVPLPPLVSTSQSR
jgi:flagellar hook-associated protein 2